MRRIVLLVIPLCTACAGQQHPSVAQLSPDSEARCRAVADSVLANVPREELPRAQRESSPVPVGRVVSATRPPPSVRLRIAFLVRPDGSADTATVKIRGSSDARFRRDAMATVSRVSLTPAKVDGCPVWSRAEIIRYMDL